jgi:hypothetical protein
MTEISAEGLFVPILVAPDDLWLSRKNTAALAAPHAAHEKNRGITDYHYELASAFQALLQTCFDPWGASACSVQRLSIR